MDPTNNHLFNTGLYVSYNVAIYNTQITPSRMQGPPRFALKSSHTNHPSRKLHFQPLPHFLSGKFCNKLPFIQNIVIHLMLDYLVHR